MTATLRPRARSTHLSVLTHATIDADSFSSSTDPTPYNSEDEAADEETSATGAVDKGKGRAEEATPQPEEEAEWSKEHCPSSQEASERDRAHVAQLWVQAGTHGGRFSDLRGVYDKPREKGTGPVWEKIKGTMFDKNIGCVPCPVEDCPFAIGPDPRKGIIQEHFIRYHYEEFKYEMDWLALPSTLSAKQQVHCIFWNAELPKSVCKGSNVPAGYGRHLASQHTWTGLVTHRCRQCNREFYYRADYDLTCDHSEEADTKDSSAPSSRKRKADTDDESESEEPAPVAGPSRKTRAAPTTKRRRAARS